VFCQWWQAPGSEARPDNLYQVFRPVVCHLNITSWKPSGEKPVFADHLLAHYRVVVHRIAHRRRPTGQAPSTTDRGRIIETFDDVDRSAWPNFFESGSQGLGAVFTFEGSTVFDEFCG